MRAIDRTSGVPVSITVRCGFGHAGILYHPCRCVRHRHHRRRSGRSLLGPCAPWPGNPLRSGKLAPTEIKDAPRFAFRGMHLDLARNF
ncbi:MAG: hypothetical protein WDN06_11375 [Asticcacaulis sp.]